MVSGLAPTGAASMAQAAVLTGIIIGPLGLVCWLATWYSGNLHWLDTALAALIVGLATALLVLFAPVRGGTAPAAPTAPTAPGAPGANPATTRA